MWSLAATERRAEGDRSAAMESSTRDAREAREARARLYGATVTFADKKRLAETLVSGLGGADGASRAGAGGGHSATPGPATAAVLSEWALATLAWAGLAADISARGPRGGGSAGSGARGGIGGGGASKKPLSKPSAPPPRAVGSDAPDAASICADAGVWRILVVALDATDEAPSASAASAPAAYRPNATAATHVVRAAAAAAASERLREELWEELFALAAACVSRFERRLGVKFKPNLGQSLVLLQACVRNERTSAETKTPDDENEGAATPRRVLTDAAFRLWTRSLRAAPHRAPAATPRDVLEAVLRSAARERAHENGDDVSDVSDVSSPLADARTRKETPALDALAAALFHPCHRDYVPAAFAAAAADAVREDAGRDQVGQGVGKKGTKEKADETSRSRSNETSVLDDEAPAAAPVDELPAAASDGAARTQPPPETVRLVASRVLHAARAGDAIGALAPWVFRAFAEDEARRARDEGHAARGGVASTTHSRSGEAAAAETARREAPSRALWDALFAPIAFHASSIERGDPYRARSNVPRSNVASELILELGRLGLYSQTAAGGGPAPPNGEAPRDRLEAFAASVFVRGGTNGASAPPDASAKALRALVATDLRLVEPHLSDAFAATWSAETLTDAASETVAAAVGAYAATRRIPECLAAVGAAAALLSASDAPASDKKGIECARVFATPAVLAAAAAAGARVPPGQIAAVVAAARDAASAAFVEPAGFSSPYAANASGSKKAKRASSSSPTAAAAERVAATCAFVATIVSSLPAVPGEALAAGARAALEGFARDLAGLVRAGSDAMEAGEGLGDAPLSGAAARKREKETKEKKRKRVVSSETRHLDDLDERSRVCERRERDAIDAARLGAALVAYVPVAATLETCHDDAELHGRAATPYLSAGAGDDADPAAPSLARVAATTLRLGGAVGAREVGAGVAGACVHRIAQLARSALPPPAGLGDAAAATEARTLAEVVTSPAALAAASAVDVLRSAEDVWTPWAEPARLEAWVRARGDGAADADEPEVLAARVAAAARAALAAARAAAETQAGGLAAACARVVAAASASRFFSAPLPALPERVAFGTSESSDSSDVAHAAFRAFWREAAAEAPQAVCSHSPATLASLATLESALARLASVPAALAARAADPAALARVAAAADCAARTVAGHASTAASCAARVFAAALANADAAAAREVVSFAAPLVADAAKEKESAETARADPRVFARSTAATAAMARAALAVAGDVAATRDVAAAVAPAVRRLAAEAAEAKRVEGADETRVPEKMKNKSLGLVPRAFHGKRAEASAPTTRRPAAPRLALGAARAAALAEATLVAAFASVPEVSEDARRERLPDARVGAAAVRARRETRGLREGVDAAVASLRGVGAFRRAFSGDESADASGGSAESAAAVSALAAAGVSARLAELCARHADERALREDPLDADATRVCVTTAAETLALSSSSPTLAGETRGGAAESAAVAAASAVAACVGLLDATGPALDVHAHAALLATVIAAYDAAARRSRATFMNTARETTKHEFFTKKGVVSAPELPAPSPRLARALESALEALTRGAGKRPLGAGYRAAVERLRDVDAACRRLSGAARTSAYTASDVAARASAPLWLLRHLLALRGGAAKAACAAHAETAFDACVAPARHANDTNGVYPFAHDDDAENHEIRDALGALSTAGASLHFSAALAAKRGVALSARCASRMAATPSSLAATLAPRGGGETRAFLCAAACASVFVPACDLLTAVLRTRREEMKRAAALVVASCAALLDALRAWHAAAGDGARRRTGTRADSTSRADGRVHRRELSSVDAETIDSACRRGGAALACVYEEAVASGLNRYCAHLLADAVTCAGGGAAGIGPAAAAALKPGIFALIDACGDRELGQIHAAFGSQAGGARRVALAALVEEHKRTHKYDGKV